jgi:protease IV
VRASGSIGMGGGGPLSGDSGIAEDELSPVLHLLENDDSVKAVVLRIDSPGGSALASDLIWHRLMGIRKRKPLVVSVGEMAASGGYYLASAANAILADRESLLGSIGVVGGKVGFGPALERFGIHGEVFPAKLNDPVAGRRAVYSSPLFAWDDETRVRVRETMAGVYDLFLSRIAEGRQMSKEKVAESAEGKIFGGQEAMRRGLVDEIGGLRDAYRKAKSLAHLSPDAVVHVVESKPNPLLDWLGASEPGAQSTAAPLSATFREALAASLATEVPSSAAFAASMGSLESVSRLLPLLRGERVLATFSYDVKVR